MNTIGMQNLCNAIIERAAEDYALAYMGNTVEGKTPVDVMNEVYRFFHSDWYFELTSVNGDWLMEHIKMRELEKAINVYEEALSVMRTCQYKLIMNKTADEPAINFIVPPRLADDFEQVVRKQLGELRKELSDLKSEND